jgi:4-carboxymuconolactone decarboxylase
MDKDMIEKGLKVRREVTGDEAVDAELSRVSEFQKPLFELVTAYCFGEVWGRPAMAPKMRALITAAIAAGANREFAVRAHIRNALRHGATKEELQELNLHVAIYAGVPAAATMMQIMVEIMKDMGID